MSLLPTELEDLRSLAMYQRDLIERAAELLREADYQFSNGKPDWERASQRDRWLKDAGAEK